MHHDNYGQPFSKNLKHFSVYVSLFRDLLGKGREVGSLAYKIPKILREWENGGRKGEREGKEENSLGVILGVKNLLSYPSPPPPLFFGKEETGA